ncbi:MAG: glycosyltransferase family 4 protein [Abditibacteriales bacterium]|nr:glycosyltransferase family 4 protein [Abditibacteriales bacterium]MDW8367739.1 glycosyltransferase family 4 protein [Abditibacteriales bacterium]
MTSLYLCYFPLSEPLVQTQVIPYLSALAAEGIGIVLLTFEPNPPRGARKEEIRERLARQGIAWYCLRYHKRPSLPATLWDVLTGTVYAACLIQRHRVSVVHARSHVPAAMAFLLRQLFGVKMLFDVRGLLAEEYEDAGVWRRNDIKFKLTKRMERKCLDAADAIVVLTERVKTMLRDGSGINGTPMAVIPCCVDVDKFRVDAQLAQVLREQLGLRDKTVLLYLGKLGSWYMAAEMVDFFAVACEMIPNLHFLILTQSDHALARVELARRGIGAEAFTLTTVAPDDVPLYLTAADVGISFIRPCFSKIASSPTKIGEYLAAGLPIVSNTGIGDCDALLRENNVGVLVEEFTDKAYRAAVAQLQNLLADRENVRRRCRAVAEQHLSLQHVGRKRYRAVYDLLRS